METQKTIPFETALSTVKRLSLVDQMRLIEWITARLKQKLSTAQKAAQRQAQFGSAKGMIAMSDDFDASLEGFKDYMP